MRNTARRAAERGVSSQKTVTYEHGFYLDEFMEGGVVRLLELFANVEKVDLATGHHDADQRPVVCAQALRGGSIDTLFILIWLQSLVLSERAETPRKY